MTFIEGYPWVDRPKDFWAESTIYKERSQGFIRDVV
jgi:hypothetical protein